MLRKLNIVAAGLFQLKGIEIKLSYSLAEAIYSVVKDLPPESILDIDEVAEKAYRIFKNSFGDTRFRIGFLYPKTLKLFKDEESEYYFRNVFIYVSSTWGYLAFQFNPQEFLSDELSINLPINQILKILNNDNYLIRNGIVDLNNIYDGVRIIVTHELRHAADFILNRNNLTSSGFDRDSSDRSIKDVSERTRNYMNHPSEMKSYAGDVARRLFHFFDGDINRFKNTELLNNHLNKSRVWKNLNPENKKIFLQRVYSEFQRLVNSGYGKEEIPKGKGIDYYKILREIARSFKKAKDFANFLVPEWKKVKEEYESFEDKKLIPYFLKEKYQFTKEKYLSFFRAFKDLLAGTDPASLSVNDIPAEYHI